ncbi:MAG: hypothetical protein ACP5HK_06090 [Acidilobus sp.]
MDELSEFREAIREYNKYRAPEAFARIVTRKRDVIYVVFDGSYCETCGLYDWVDDLKFVLEGKGLRTEIVKLHEPEGPAGSKRIAAFKVLKETGSAKLK